MRTIGVIAGDGVGPEVVREGLAVLDLVAKRDGLNFERKTFDLGADRYLKTGEVLSDESLEALKKCDAIYLGAVGDP
ncbi:MAG TPA: isocitrate/isopropylmalate family dehydrogenase, partial [Isosphaeraceae bacterium]|nr:isocitrate/isopropylmalate family dehydrogenase [Isosphaeraceae bacterium]